MTRRSIAEFVDGLSGIPRGEFTLHRVADYLREHPVAPESLGRYVTFAPTHYTRNLIHRSDLFEIMAIGWEQGQASRIHNHQGQNCWMAAPVGRLVVQNYHVVRMDVSRGRCELEEADRAIMDAEHPAFVDPARPVHAVINPPEHGARAVTLHVYSHPYDHCLVYSREKNTYSDVPLFFDTEYGKPVGS